MLNEKVSQLLNDQVNKEFYSAYLYLQFSNFYVEQGLAGFANWYKVQAQEERDPEIDALVQQRTEAKKAKNWAEADRIRDELKARGITITDTPQGTKWSRQ